MGKAAGSGYLELMAGQAGYPAIYLKNKFRDPFGQHGLAGALKILGPAWH